MWIRKAVLLMFPIMTLTVSPFLVPEPQESSVQLPNCFMFQKVGCLLTKVKTDIFYQEPQLLELLIVLTRCPQHSSENTASFSFPRRVLFFLSPLLTVEETVFLAFCAGLGLRHPFQYPQHPCGYLNLNQLK